MTRSTLLCLALLLFLPACGDQFALAGTWVPDIYETRQRWDNLKLDRENTLADAGKEQEEGFGPSSTEARDRIITLWEKLELTLRIESATSFSFTRMSQGKRQRGSGRCEADGDMITLFPEKGTHFLRGRSRVKFIHRNNRLEEIRTQAEDMKEVHPVLLLKRK